MHNPKLATCDPPLSQLGHEVRVLAGNMNDSVRVGPGPFRASVDLGTGSDNARVANGQREAVACGAGIDQVVADPVDVVASDCELVIAASALRRRLAELAHRAVHRAPSLR
ncbi:MAG: hypothetical protein WD844_13865 [Thermoleophilaceae bacterium]